MSQESSSDEYDIQQVDETRAGNPEPSTRTLKRLISPPPLRSRGNHASLSQISSMQTQNMPSPAAFSSSRAHDRAEESHEAASLTVPKRQKLGDYCMKWYDRGNNRLYFVKSTPRMQLNMLNDHPRRFGGVRGALPSEALLSDEVAEGVRKALERTQADGGGLVYVDLPPDIMNPPNNSRTVPKAETTKVEPSLLPGSHTLCWCCQKVVKESRVLNRPWRSMQINVGEQTSGVPYSVRIKKKNDTPYHGQKVDVFGHHGQLGVLKKSARGGCHLCSLLDSYDPHAPFTYDERCRTPYILKVIYEKKHDEGPGVLELEAKGHPAKSTYLMYKEPPEKSAPTLRCNRTDAPETLELARQWLHICQKSHEACRTGTSITSTFRPTRLVKVQASSHSVQHLQLVLEDNLPQAVIYLTLSHCWGGANIIKLTQDTLASFQVSIPLANMPKNFFDAFLTTAALGYEYIWIDSLCIIQDSKSDWKSEAALMGSVYQHSACTIAAVGSKDSHGGCFITRSALSFTPCQLIPKSARTPGVYAENWYSQLRPLHTRAWVVQERGLSVRTLSFGAEMLEWDCISATASEFDPVMQETGVGVSLKRTFYELLQCTAQGEGGFGTKWINTWWKIVEVYSSCNLTFATDKWAAIQGLAVEAERTCGLRLFHGLWEHDLANELLWTVLAPKKRRLDIGAPSWSWLGIDGKVLKRRYNYSQNHQPVAQAEIYNANTSGHYEEDRKGHAITVVARMIRIIWALRSTDSEYTPSFPFRLRDGRRSTPSKPLEWDGSWIPDVLPDKEWETWALQIAFGREGENLRSNVGLIVVPTSAEGYDDAWIRVGSYEFIWREDVAESKRWFGDRRRVTLL